MASSSSHTRILFRCFTGFLVLLAAIGRPITKGIISQNDEQSRGFQRFGFVDKGFSYDQHQIIESVLLSYERVLGGHGRLARIIRYQHFGEDRQISFDPQGVGANSEILLSPSVFNCKLSQQANFSCYGALDDTAHARIVIGHEVGHLLIRAVRNRTRVNWGIVYASRISRNWDAINDPNAGLEEAVTELSLKVINAGYYFSISTDSVENDLEIIGQIEAWVAEFLAELRKM